MKMLTSYAKGWANTFNIEKKTNRKEYWEFVFVDLLLLLIPLTIVLIDSDARFFLTPFLAIAFLPFYFISGFLTRITLLTRRIIDTGRSSNWLFWVFFPPLGWLILAIFTLQRTCKDSCSRYGRPIPVRVLSKLNEENSSTKTINKSIESKLEELKSLKEKGLISEKEYEQLRRNNLGL